MDMILVVRLHTILRRTDPGFLDAFARNPGKFGLNLPHESQSLKRKSNVAQCTTKKPEFIRLL